jgi:hypothetical protein
MDRLEENGQEAWLLTEFSTEGVPVIRCKISVGKSRCH